MRRGGGGWRGGEGEGQLMEESMVLRSGVYHQKKPSNVNVIGL